MKILVEKRVQGLVTQMTAPTTNEGTIERIRKAVSREEVDKLVAHACGFQNIPDEVLRRINRAAVRRNKELSKP